ncbi:hypothetical protein AB395_00001918 [Sinorhizobium fredii CCBAU 45436]|nr:hypothetical protein SF83666_c18700 [Sinorhizobium fredii CCBAU 83666]AWI57572.1 hypothetical protein AB395_00001918 [Sinorhizobium fredii CCBAU 45436]
MSDCATSDGHSVAFTQSPIPTPEELHCPNVAMRNFFPVAAFHVNVANRQAV